VTLSTGFRARSPSGLLLLSDSVNKLSRHCPMLNDDFKEWLRLLNANHVEYLVVGGYALAAHGHPRFTGDIDVWFRSSPENVSRLLESLNQFGFGALGIRANDLLTENAVIQLGYPPSRIDLLANIDGVVFDECLPRRIEILVGDVLMPVIGLAEFRRNKLAAGRPKDLADLDALKGET
jgi:hypothetical protein